ncbi:MAG: hypothetical protein LBF27_17705 [Sphingobacterium sp.]|jgi:hypothetical protein|nr:hypothetical protein [Sphingobacterium sp.]
MLLVQETGGYSSKQLQELTGKNEQEKQQETRNEKSSNRRQVLFLAKVPV